MIELAHFLDDYPSFRQHCDGLEYRGMKNPADDVFYPGVTTDIPPEVAEEVLGKVSEQMQAMVRPSAMFLRLSSQGTYAPHQAHTDAVMGEYSLMLYLNRQEHCQGGTAFVEHVTGMDVTPRNRQELALWEQDHSDPEKWRVVETCDMAENKACLFNAHRMHRAEPIGGFGHGPQDGRLVLTMFFDAEAA